MFDKLSKWDWEDFKFYETIYAIYPWKKKINPKKTALTIVHHTRIFSMIFKILLFV